MRTQWSRAGAVLGLLAAIFSDLRRRAWWAYRRGGLPAYEPRTTIVAPRPAEWNMVMPNVDANWRAVVERALAAQAGGVVLGDGGDSLPVVWIDAGERPDIADLPRVLGSGADAGDGPPLIAAQWLADLERQRVVLVATLVEPVACTWAIGFDLPRRRALLERIVEEGALWVAWSDLPPRADQEPDPVLTALPDSGLLLPLNGRARLQLGTTVRAWARPQAPRLLP